MDLVDEEDRARLERSQEGRYVGFALERRARGLHHRHLELGGDDVGERGLAEPGRAGEQHVVEGLAALSRRGDEDLELVGDLDLVDEVLEPRRAQAAVEVLVAADRRPGVLDPDLLIWDVGGADPLAGLDRLHAASLAPAAWRSADWTSSSALSPEALSSSFSASAGV